MNGFEKHKLDEDAFGERPGIGSGLRTFDAFPKTKPTYTTSTRRGGQWTIIVFALCAFLSLNELRTWYRGVENHHFSVEKGVSRELQMNLDIVVAMTCDALRVNVQDAAGDRILASDLLDKQPTSWAAWNRELNGVTSGGGREYQTLNEEDSSRLMEQEADVHVGHALGEAKRSYKRKFPKGPKLKRGEKADSCRIYGSLEGNKVQGDFHITARGHGYPEYGEHLSHDAFNFSHMVTELSFGPHYPSLLNPLDKTISVTPARFFKFQYYLSVVPTIYTRAGIVDPYNHVLPDPTTIRPSERGSTIFTNQYAATSQSLEVPDPQYHIPGIFFKYNIEPILLVVSEERGSLLALLVRLVNVLAGVVVAGGWLFQISTWAMENLKRRQGKSEGVLNGKVTGDEDE
ncbi:COPII-coated vesicle protein [Histoplasma ohiense]|nr:COPII-coated vesicle protein [Histoplasma ohiense (nom. inval.)]